jgi:hypothetical protein
MKEEIMDREGGVVDFTVSIRPGRGVQLLAKRVG